MTKANARRLASILSIRKGFSYDRKLETRLLAFSVVEAYNDIMLLMPDLDKKGKQDEDWYLSEWLCNERPYYSIIKGKDKKDVAYHIYTIRKV